MEHDPVRAACDEIAKSIPQYSSDYWDGYRRALKTFRNAIERKQAEAMSENLNELREAERAKEALELATRILEAEANELCEHCDLETGYICDRCTMLQLISDLRYYCTSLCGGLADGESEKTQ